MYIYICIHIYSLLNLECHPISNLHVNLVSLFSLSKRDLETHIIHIDLRLKKSPNTMGYV